MEESTFNLIFTAPQSKSTTSLFLLRKQNTNDVVVGKNFKQKFEYDREKQANVVVNQIIYEKPEVPLMPCIHFDDHKQTLFFPFVKNGELSHLCTVDQGLRENMAKEIFFQVCKGIDELHKKNYAHKDIKITNVLISCYMPFQIKVIDFGHTCEFVDGQTQKEICGTIFCLPLELHDSFLKKQPQEYDPVKLDIFALGILLLTSLSCISLNRSQLQRVKSNNPFKFWAVQQQRYKDKFKKDLVIESDMKAFIMQLLQQKFNNIEEVLEHDMIRKYSQSDIKKIFEGGELTPIKHTIHQSEDSSSSQTHRSSTSISIEETINELIEQLEGFCNISEFHEILSDLVEKEPVAIEADALITSDFETNMPINICIQLVLSLISKEQSTKHNLENVLEILESDSEGKNQIVFYFTAIQQPYNDTEESDESSDSDDDQEKSPEGPLQYEIRVEVLKIKDSKSNVVRFTSVDAIQDIWFYNHLIISFNKQLSQF